MVCDHDLRPQRQHHDHATPNLRNFQRALAKPVEFEIHKYRIIELQFSASRPTEPSDHIPSVR